MLTAGGLPLGTVDGHERSAELDPAAAVFLEFKCPGRLPVQFFFDEAFLADPPDHVRLYYTREAVAVYVYDFPRAEALLRPLAQERLQGTLLTLYLQGGVQLSLENETGFHIVDLPDPFEQGRIAQAGELFLIEAPENFCLINRSGEVLVLSEGTVSEREPHVCAEVPFHDSLGHTAACTFEEGKLTDCRIRTARKPTAATYALALFESALIGADCTPYLAENLTEKKDALGEYLGKYCSVVLTGSAEVVGLVYERKPRVYDVRYFSVTLEEDGKISNIRPL